MTITKNSVFYVYLDIDQLPVAWATYRGALISASFIGTDNFRPLSNWVCNLIRKNQILRLQKELLIEKVRKDCYPEKISRLHGMYYWGDKDSAEHAEIAWRAKEGRYFDKEYLAEVAVSFIKEPSRVDTTWIDVYLLNNEVALDLNDISWIHNYWQGKAYDSHPKWEYIVEGYGVVWGTELRRRAYEQIEKKYPALVGQLEIARIACETNKNLGQISPFISKTDDNTIRCDYFIDFRDFNASFLKDIEKYEKQHPDGINRKALGQLKTCQHLPDLRNLAWKLDLTRIHSDILIIMKNIVSPYCKMEWILT